MSDEELPRKPKIKDKCELQEKDDEPVLLYPEGLVKLNRSGYEILKRADGTHTLDEITDLLENLYDQENLENEVRDFLTGIQQEGLLTDAGG